MSKDLQADIPIDLWARTGLPSGPCLKGSVALTHRTVAVMVAR